MKRTQTSSGPEAPSEERQRSVAPQAANYQDHDDTSKARDEAVYQEPTTLCSRCSSIDIGGLFLNVKNGYGGRRLTNLGTLGAEAALSSCSLCRLFHTMRIQEDENSSVNDYALYSTSPPSPCSSCDGLVLAVARDAGRDHEEWDWVNNIHDMGASSGFITYSEVSETAPHAKALRARAVVAGSIDFDIIRGWMQHCDQEHTKCCIQVKSPASHPKDLKLIYCELRRLVLALPSYKYSALSYVWGTSRSGDADRCVHDELPKTLPRTIEDALKVTKELGLRYIWVDRYCIDQEKDAEKQIQIQQMDLVYRKANVTIVAAAGTDPDFGLPGVNATPRTPQPTAWIGGRCLVSTLPDPYVLLEASKWMSRAWTYQEGFFSTRRIFFTEQQVNYECRAGTACETIENFFEFESYASTGGAMDDEHSPWVIYYHLTQYCGRELSVDADAIRALEGVFNSFRRGRSSTHQYLGIPIAPIMPSVVEQPKGKWRKAKHSRGEAFAAGLCWCNTAPGTRRTLFPTWSWAGWTAPINYEGDFHMDGLQLQRERPLKVFIENYDGSLSDMDKQNDITLRQGIPGSSSKFIHIEAWTIPIDIQYMPDETQDWIDESPTARRDRNVSGYIAKFQDDERTLLVPLFSLCQTYENGVASQQSYAPDSKQDGLLGIILGRCEDVSDISSRDRIFIMVVHDREHYYERVGHMSFDDTMLRSLPDNSIATSDYTKDLQLCFRLKKRRTIRLG